jgi:phytoene synthase
MKQLFDDTSAGISKLITKNYSTSFTLGIAFLSRRFHRPIYNIYGFVRCADEIVDSFHGYDKRNLLNKFKQDTFTALESRISTNPVLNSFQETVNKYGIKHEHIHNFFRSMEMDLEQQEYNQSKFDEYILGSAEVVGLMCLHVFTENNINLYNNLSHFAMKLGSAFQKVNFLRDLKSDLYDLGRFYFPGGAFNAESKIEIEKEIQAEFREALEGIRKLPSGVRPGVYLAYSYYYKLFLKIKSYPPSRVMKERIRLPNSKKISLIINCLFKEKLNFL